MRAIEQLGMGLLVASVVAVVLLPVARWQGMAAGPVVWLAGGLALLIAIVRLRGRWVTRGDAVVLADSQLRLGELLITALSTAAYGNEAFCRAVRSQADAACEGHRASEVLLRRMGIRSWSAVGLALSLAVVLAVIPLGPSRSSAVDANASVLTANSNVDGVGLKSSTSVAGNVNDPNSEGASSDAMSGGKDSSPTKFDGANSGTGKSQSVAAGGGGSASSESNPVADRRHDQTSGRNDANAGSSAGGGAAAAGNPGSPGSGGFSAGSTGDHQPAPEWSGQTGHVETGDARTVDQAPPADRDLIRDFFAR